MNAYFRSTINSFFSLEKSFRGLLESLSSSKPLISFASFLTSLACLGSLACFSSFPFLPSKPIIGPVRGAESGFAEGELEVEAEEEAEKAEGVDEAEKAEYEEEAEEAEEAEKAETDMNRREGS